MRIVQNGKTKATTLPKAQVEGVLKLGSVEIPCAVLGDGRRLITEKGLLTALGRAENPRGGVADKLAVFVGADNLKPLVSEAIQCPTNPVHFRPLKGGGKAGVATGYSARVLTAICRVYTRANRAGVIRANQAHIVERCETLLDALADVGIEALIDEATGYQKLRADDALQAKLALYLSEQMKPWACMFHEGFWRELNRIYGRKGAAPTDRPKYFGKVLHEVVYGSLDPEVAEHLKANKPPSTRDQRWHQWFATDFGARALKAHVSQIEALMRVAKSPRHLRDLVAESFGHGHVQVTMYLPQARA